MKQKIYKTFTMIALLLMAGQGFAQDTDNGSDDNLHIAGINLNINKQDMHLAMSEMKMGLDIGLRELKTTLHLLGPEVKNADNALNISIYTSGDEQIESMVQNGSLSEKVKSYTKS